MGMTEHEMVGWHHQLTGYEFWVNSGSWWWTGRPGMLQSTGSQRVRHDWESELNWTEFKFSQMPISQTSIVIEKLFSPLQFVSITQILIFYYSRKILLFYCKPGTVLGADYIGLDKEDMVINLIELTNIRKTIVIILEILCGHCQEESNLFRGQWRHLSSSDIWNASFLVLSFYIYV